MKSIKILKYFIVFTLLISTFIPNELMGQPGFASGTFADGSGSPNYSCSNEVFVKVRLTNLELYSPQSQEWYFPTIKEYRTVEFLPKGYPPMFIELTYNNTTEAFPIDYFIDAGIESGIGKKVYYAYANLSYAVCTQCKTTDDIFVAESYKLVKADGTLYPVCKYTGDDDIFSCYYNINHPCKDKGQCNEEGLASRARIKTIKCSEYHVDPETFPGEVESKTDGNLNVFPNPFKEELTIKIPKDIQDGTLEILDLNGISVSNLKNVQGGSSHQINTKNLNGSTFVIIITDKSNQYTKRVIKL